MQTLELENYGTVEMNSTELVGVDGGVFEIPKWDKIWKLIEKIDTAIGIGDAVDRFVTGFNSTNCHN
jgi:hypothetical protein